MASLNPRWNVSGTYMQVLPAFISTDQEGKDEKEFLLEYFKELPDLLSMVFLKGYQWPFDVNKVFGGSSVIDLLVYQETVIKGRRVFLDYRINPGKLKESEELPYASLIPAALWLKASKRMSAAAGMIRSRSQMEEAFRETSEDIRDFQRKVRKPEVSQLALFYKLYDMLLSQKVYLFAMLDYAKAGGASRGSALYTDPQGELPGFKGCEPFGELYRCKLDQKTHGKEVQEVVLKDGEPVSSRRPVRPIPEVDYFFENQWRAYRKRAGIDG